jgi:hypothetical protein
MSSRLAPHLWCILALAAAVTYTPSVHAQTIDGIMLERGTERPIDLGRVTLLTVTGVEVVSGLTDQNGRFSVTAPEGGDFLLSAGALGYRRTNGGVFVLGEEGRMSIELRLEPQAIEIGGITIETRSALIDQPNLVLNGFVERAQSGFGTFITPGDIENSAAFTATQLLAQTGRVQTAFAIGGDRIQMRGSMGFCTPSVYLDGVRISMQGLSLDAIAPLAVLEAAEVYRTASQAPLRYGGGLGGCGVVVLWTRAR